MLDSEKRGLIIAIEGGDGCGTTTHASLLAEGLRSWLPLFPARVLDGMGLSGEIRVLRGPSDSDFGQHIRRKFESGGFESPRAAAMAFALDRREQYETEVRGLLGSGYIVIFDRYVHSSVVHQGMAGAGTDFVISCNSEVPRPDIVLHLHVEPRVAARRIVIRTDDPMSSSSSILQELELQRVAWESAWSSASALGYPAEGFRPAKIDTGKGEIAEVAKVVLAEVTAQVLEKCLARNPS